MKLLLATLLLLPLPALCETAPNPAIILPASPAPAEQFAAEELQRYFRRITGSEAALQRERADSPDGGVFIGATTAAKAAGLSLESRFPEDDQYRLLLHEGSFYAIGARPRGTLFAVYDLLERLGCRWFAPGYRFYKGMHKHVPRAERLELPQALDVREVPDFKYRIEFCEHYFLHEPDDVVALIDWCAKNRINMLDVRLNEFSGAWYRVLYPEIERRDMMLGAEAHAFDRFLSRSRYFAQHPEWFGLINGENSDRYFDQFQLGHPEAMATFQENVREFVQQFPGLYALSAMPNDSPRWADPDLKAADSEELLEKTYDTIAKIVHETNPRMKVTIGVGVEYFGQDGTELWESSYPNILWHTAVLRRTMQQAWNDPESLQNWPQYEKAAAMTKRLVEKGQDVIWSSRYGSFRDIGLPGLIYPEVMAEELRDLKKIGGAGINFNYAVPDCWIPLELKHYLFARLAWDTETDPAEVLRAYYRDRFPGAPEAMEEFYTALRSAMERYAYPGGGYSREDQFGLYPANKFEQGFAGLARAKSALERAFAQTESDQEKQLTWLLEASLEFARRKMHIDQLDQTGKRDEAAREALELMDWLELWTMKGIVYDSSFLRMRVERRFTGMPRDVPIKGVPADNLRVFEFKDYMNPENRQKLPDVVPPDPPQ